MNRPNSSDTVNRFRGHESVDEDNQRLENDLRGKISQLKTLTIDIGSEVRYQNKMLNDMDDEFDSTDGILGSSLKRLQRMSRAGHNRIIFYLLLFSMFVFFVIWLLTKWR